MQYTCHFPFCPNRISLAYGARDLYIPMHGPRVLDTPDPMFTTRLRQSLWSKKKLDCGLVPVKTQVNKILESLESRISRVRTCLESTRIIGIKSGTLENPGLPANRPIGRQENNEGNRPGSDEGYTRPKARHSLQSPPNDRTGQ